MHLTMDTEITILTLVIYILRGGVCDPGFYALHIHQTDKLNA